MNSRAGRRAVAARLPAVLLAMTAALLLWPWPAEGQWAEQVVSLDLAVQIRPDGALAVTETIVYDFGGASRHGIERFVDTSSPLDELTDRVYRIGRITASSPSGAPNQLQVSEEPDTTRIRVGDPARTITGRHTYVLRYELHGHLNALDDHDELYWQATGTRWTVPIRQVNVVVRAPGGIQRAGCLAGRPDSTSLCSATILDQRMASMSHPGLSQGEGVTVVVALTKGTVAVAPPELRNRFWRPSPAAAFAVAGMLVLSTAAGCALVWNRFGRDRKYAAMPLGLTPAPGQPAVEQPVRLVGEPQPAVSFVPPRGVRPALAGLLVNERALPEHLGATIVDLAARGHLLIEELPAELGAREWRLHRRQPPPGDELEPFEHELLDRLFADGDRRLLSKNRRAFLPDLRSVLKLLTEQGRAAGWFRRRPRIGYGASAVIYGLLAVIVIGLLSPYLINGVPSNLLGKAGPTMLIAAAIVGSGVMIAITLRNLPARTALGRAVWAQVRGFRRYLETAEADSLRDDEAAARFTRYLPYALIFGITDRWTTILAQLERPPNIDWYTGPHDGNWPWLGPAMADFTTSTHTLSSPGRSASGSSGFSSTSSVRGGSGGGGGGSW